MTAILGIGRVTADLARATSFYHDALGFEIRNRSETETIMRLGAEEIRLVRPEPVGAPYPPDSRSDDLWFQHLAIVVADMDAALAHLRRHTGWRAISLDGPVLLPPENGSVRAFKFRDPDGHPLELIWFPGGWRREAPGPFLGIDHSALAVADTARSVAFYESLGFTVAARSLNHGPAQEQLDAVPNARVEVTGLRCSETGMGLELLAYDPPGRASMAAPNDIASDRVMLGRATRELRDPDGHRLSFAD